MNKIYILVVAALLASCSESNQEKAKTDALNKNDIQVNEENMVKQTISSQDTASNIVIEHKATSQKNIMCLDKNITEWYGFDESIEEPTCQKVNSLKINSKKCNSSPNAFGADLDALLFEENDQRFFIYETLNDCNQALEIRNSNGP